MKALSVALISLLAASSQAQAAKLPRLGQCFDTRVAGIESRLWGVPSSGSALKYANGLFQVSYEIVPGMARSRIGDPVRLCVAELPKNCPKGDDRGIVYRTRNFRTGEAWTAADSEHECGGA